MSERRTTRAVRVALDALPARAGLTGIGRYAQTLANTLPTMDSKREYVLVAAADNFPTLNPHGKRLPLICPNGDRLWYASHLPNELRGQNVDIYHSPLFTCPQTKACKYVVTLHDVIPLATPEFCQPEFQEFFERLAKPCLELADKIVTVSEFSRRDILKYLSLPEEKVVVVPECVSEEFRPLAEGEQVDAVLGQIGLRRPYILYVGSIERRKNVDGLLAAYAKLPKSLRDELPLVIIGRRQPDGIDVQDMAAKLDIAANVLNPGYAPDGALAVLYRAAEMFVFPSHYEGFGLPVLEAMASGTPVITSNIASLPEVAGGAALLVNSKEVEIIAASIIKVHEDESLRQELAERGLRRASDFSPDKMVQKFAEVYDDLGRDL